MELLDMKNKISEIKNTLERLKADQTLEKIVERSRVRMRGGTNRQSRGFLGQ